MNSVQTFKLFLTALGVSALFVAPASAGVIYTTSFGSVTTSGSPAVSGASQLTNAGSYYLNFGFGSQTGNGTLAVNNPDIYAYTFTGANGISGDGSGTNTGLLLASSCNPSGNCNTDGFNGASGVGAITLSLTGLTAGQQDNVSVQFWATTTGAGFVTANPNNLGLTIDVGGAALSSSLASTSQPFAVTTATTGTFETASLNFTPTGTSAVITLLDDELTAASAGAPPAPIVGNITVASVATPEPSSALFLLIPAALFAAYRRRSARQN